jgi:hypothetical protein
MIFRIFTVLLAIVVMSTSAFAGEWELVLPGITHATPTADGTWWQKPLPHHLTLDSLSLGIDYREHVIGNWSALIGAEYLGRFGMSAEWVPDADYSTTTQTVKPGSKIMHAHGNGFVAGMYIAPEYTMHMGHGVSEDVFAGLWVYDADWSITVPDEPYKLGLVSMSTRHPQIHASYMFGMQLNVGHIGARFTVFDARAHQQGPAFPALYNGPAFNGSFVYRW